MFWEEKIDILKRKYPPEQFQVPFTTWSEILRKIEAKFFIQDRCQRVHPNCLGTLKNEVQIKTVSPLLIIDEISKLDSTNNYWVIIAMDNTPTSKYYIYDCQISSMKQLVSMAPADFFIVAKKYDWLTYFKVNRDSNEVLLSRSGNKITPFDRV